MSLKTLLCHSLICCRSFSSLSSSIVVSVVTSASEVVNEVNEAVVSKEVEVLEEY